MIYPKLQAGLVRIYTLDREISGIGFLISPRHILCTASTVSASLDQQSIQDQSPDKEILLHFYGGPTLKGRVIVWRPVIFEETIDVAIVELSPQLILDINPLHLAISESPIGRIFKTIGFIPGKEDPILVQGKILGGRIKTELEFMELEFEGAFQLPGFIGAPIWDSDVDAVVGMLTLITTEQGTFPRFLPLEFLIEILPDLALRFPAEKPGPLHNVPDLPPNFILRKDYSRHLRSALLTGRQIRTGKGTLFGTTGYVGVTTTGPSAALRSERIVLQGPPGIGKTTLAAAVVRDDYLRRVYPDGIFWLSLGYSPDLTLSQATLARMAGASYGGYIEPRQGRRALRGLLSNRACLIVLDDVWEASHAASFDCLGPRGMLLIIGREIGLAGALRARRIQLGPMLSDEAMELICLWAGEKVSNAPTDAVEIIQECESNPLALTLTGATLRTAINNWADVLARLRNIDTSPYASRLGSFRRLIASILLTYSTLPIQVKERFLELAVFPPGATIPHSAIYTLWKSVELVKEIKQEILALLINRNLIQLDSRGQGRSSLILHDYIYAFIRFQISDLAFLHQHYIHSYGMLPPDDDGWIVGHLISHLRQAGFLDDICHLLFNYQYLYQRLSSGGVDELINDYTIALASFPLSLWDSGHGGEALHIVQNAIHQAAAVLSKNQNALPSQLIGRLVGFDDPYVQKLISGAMNEKRFKWLRPLTNSLSYPGNKCLYVLSGHFGKVNALVVTLDGLKLISAGVDKEIRIWDIDDGRLLCVMSGHDAPINDLALTPDGKCVISASIDGTIRLWLLSDGSCIKTLRGHQSQVIAVAPTPDGRRLISSGSDRTLCVWDLERSALIRTYKLHDGWAKAAAVLPGSLQAISGCQEIKLWDIETGQVMYTLDSPHGAVSSLLLSSDGSILISTSLGRDLTIWDVLTGRTLHTLSTPGGRVIGLAIVYGTHRAIVACSDKHLYTLNIDSGKFIDSIEFPSTIDAISITPDGRKVVLAYHDGTISIWDRNNYRRLRTLRGHTSRISQMKIMPDEKRAVSCSADGSIKVWDLASGSELFQLQNQGIKSLSLACTKNGRIILGGFEDGTIRVWDLFDQYPPQIHQSHTGPILALDITPDGRRAISGSADATLNVWDIEPLADKPLGSWSLRSELLGHTSWVRGVKALPDNWRALSVSADRTIKLWDIENGKLIYSLDAHQGEINDLALLAHGLLVVTAGDDHLLRVWDIKTGQLLYRLIGHEDEINSVAATLDGNRIVSAANDRSVRIWDIPIRRKTFRRSQEETEGKLIKTSLFLEEHTDWVNSVAVTSDGKRALSASEDKTIIEWDISEHGDSSLGKRPSLLPAHKGRVLAMANSFDGRFLLSSGIDQITYLWWIQRDNRNRLNHVNCKLKGRLFEGATNILSFFMDGMHFCSSGEDKIIRIWEIDQFDIPIRELKGHQNAVDHLCVSKRGDRVWSADGSPIIRVYEANSGNLTGTIDDLESKILTLNCLSKSDQIMAVTRKGRIHRWNALTTKSIFEADLLKNDKPIGLKRVAIDSSGKIIAGFSEDGDILVWDISATRKLRPGKYAGFNPFISITPSTNWIENLSISKHGKSLAMISTNYLEIWDYSNQRQVAKYQADSDFQVLCVSPYSRLIFTGDMIGRIHFLYLES